jgi:hypothetical protein
MLAGFPPFAAGDAACTVDKEKINTEATQPTKKWRYRRISEFLWANQERNMG